MRNKRGKEVRFSGSSHHTSSTLRRSRKRLPASAQGGTTFLIWQVRFPVILNSEEKELARKVVRAFGQTICGFDILRSEGKSYRNHTCNHICNHICKHICKHILRSEGKSYVCDVNGWASVKDSEKFWDDAALLLRSHVLQILTPCAELCAELCAEIGAEIGAISCASLPRTSTKVPQHHLPNMAGTMPCGTPSPRPANPSEG